jgi:type 1 fimbria pilin
MNLKLAVMAATLAALFPAVADAQSRIAIQGRVTAGTCSVDDVSVTLPDVSLADLPAQPGAFGAHREPAQLLFSGCAGVTGIEMTFRGAANPVDAGRFANEASTGPQDIAVWLVAKGQTIRPGSTHALAVSGADAVFDFHTGYWWVGGSAPSRGDVLANITVEMAYQ